MANPPITVLVDALCNVGTGVNYARIQEVQPLRLQWSSGTPGRQNCSNEVAVKVGHSASSGLSLATPPQRTTNPFSEAHSHLDPTTDPAANRKPTSRILSSEDVAIFPVDHVWCINLSAEARSLWAVGLQLLASSMCTSPERPEIISAMVFPYLLSFPQTCRYTDFCKA